MPLLLTPTQSRALAGITAFLADEDDSAKVFLLKGYAGTGKTTLVKFVVEHLRKQNQQVCLMASTARAAAVLSSKVGFGASTIHSLIYQYKSFNKDIDKIISDKTKRQDVGQLYLMFEPRTIDKDKEISANCVYIIDEASMISDYVENNPTQAKFGSGRLLTELLAYDTRKGSKFIFVGDPCQLPPVLGTFSPALSAEYFKDEFGITVREASLAEIIRQDNSIVQAGALIRQRRETAPEDETVYIGKPRNTYDAPIPFSQFPDIKIHTDNGELERLYLNDVKCNGYEKAIYICPSNRQCSQLAQRFRADIGFSGPVQKGDLLMVTQNQLTTGLLNGSMVEVISVGELVSPTSNWGHRVSLTFREITVRELFTDNVHNTLFIETVLYNNLLNLDIEQQTSLFYDFILRMYDQQITKSKTPDKFEKAMRDDPFLNAMRCTYGYAVTCHKAQGGEWDSAYVQMQRNVTLNPTKGKYQWLYTAITRAKTTVHVARDFFVA